MSNNEPRSPLLDAMREIASKDEGKMDFHGKKYTPVALRVQRLRETYGDQCAIYTDLVARDDHTVVMKAEVWGVVNEDWVKLATGFAEEVRSSRGVNSTSALENCETSAVGRALAALGLGGGEYASADELTGAIHQQSQVDEDKVRRAHEAIKEKGKNKEPSEEQMQSIASAWRSLNATEKTYLWRELDNPRKSAVRKAQNEVPANGEAGDDPSEMEAA